MSRNTLSEDDLGLTPTEAEMEAPTGPEIEDDGQPDTADAPAPAVEDAAADPKMVDVRALQEARSEAREARRATAVMEQRWNEYFAQQQPKPAEPEIPQFRNDPIGAGQWTQDQIVAAQQQQATQRQEAETTAREQQRFEQTFKQVNDDYVVAERADPSLTEAYSALRGSYGNELLAMGYTQPQAIQELERIERGHVNFVAERGLDIGQYLKSLATARGWQPQQQAPARPSFDPAAIASRQMRHQSLSDAPGGEVVAPTNAKQLANMPLKQFNAWMGKDGSDDKIQDILGR